MITIASSSHSTTHHRYSHYMLTTHGFQRDDDFDHHHDSSSGLCHMGECDFFSTWCTVLGNLDKYSIPRGGRLQQSSVRASGLNIFVNEV